MKAKIKYFRLEFNEKQQNFHHSYPHQKREPNTHGWVTIAEFCTDDEFFIFETFINRKRKKKISTDYVLKSFSELKTFWNDLIKNGFGITKTPNP